MTTAATRAATPPQARLSRSSPAITALDEVDDEGDALEVPAGAEAVLEEVGVVAGEAVAGVALHGDPRRPAADLGHVEELQAVAPPGRGLADLGQLAQEAVELRRGDAVGG